MSKPNLNNNKSLTEAVDLIASNYIMTQNFQDMKQLSDMKYCDDLVILTSNIINSNLNEIDVEFLSQRIKDGVESNEMNKEKFIILNKKLFDKLDIRSKKKKKHVCIGIAKFYVQIAHLFAAIMTTINPTYEYKDSSGKNVNVPLLDKESIPEDTQTQIKRINLCSKRQNALTNNEDYDAQNASQRVIKPNYCGMNYDYSY